MSTARNWAGMLITQSWFSAWRAHPSNIVRAGMAPLKEPPPQALLTTHKAWPRSAFDWGRRLTGAQRVRNGLCVFLLWVRHHTKQYYLNSSMQSYRLLQESEISQIHFFGAFWVGYWKKVQIPVDTEMDLKSLVKKISMSNTGKDSLEGKSNCHTSMRS